MKKEDSRHIDKGEGNLLATHTIKGKNGGARIGFRFDEIRIDFSLLPTPEEEKKELIHEARKVVIETAKDLYGENNFEDILVWLTAENEKDEAIYSSVGYGYFNDAEKGIGRKNENDTTVYDFADTLTEVQAHVEKREKLFPSIKEENPFTEPKITMAHVNLALAETGLVGMMERVPELYGVDNPEVSENDPDYGAYMFIGRLQIEDEGLHFEDTETKPNHDTAVIMEELLETAKRYANTKMAIAKEDNGLVKYLAVGDTDENNDFTGRVYANVGGGVYDENYMFKGKYLANQNTDGADLENSDKDRLLGFLMEDKDFPFRAHNIVSIFAELNNEGQYCIEEHMEDKVETDKPTFFKGIGGQFEFPSFGNILNTRHPEETEHTPESLLSRKDFFRIATKLIDDGYSKAITKQHVYDVGLKEAISPEIYNELMEVVSEGIEAKNGNSKTIKTKHAEAPRMKR